MIHDFKERLAWSQSFADEPFWEACYALAFPDMVGCFACPKDSESQRKGVDRLIHLSNGRTLYVDEKKRGKEYGDILLEFVSNDRTGTLGWVEKKLDD